eukprot:scaffold55295_cov27-Tisochrysis_lutea.AAC.3
MEDPKEAEVATSTSPARIRPQAWAELPASTPDTSTHIDCPSAELNSELATSLSTTRNLPCGRPVLPPAWSVACEPKLDIAIDACADRREHAVERALLPHRVAHGGRGGDDPISRLDAGKRRVPPVVHHENNDSLSLSLSKLKAERPRDGSLEEKRAI